MKIYNNPRNIKYLRGLLTISVKCGGKWSALGSEVGKECPYSTILTTLYSIPE